MKLSLLGMTLGMALLNGTIGAVAHAAPTGVAPTGALVDPSLSNFGNSTHRRVIFLPRLVTEVPKPTRYDRLGVIRYYREVARRSAMPVFEDVQSGRLPGVTIEKVYWINSSIAADVTVDGLRLLARHPAVYKIYAARNIERDNFVRGQLALPLEEDGLRYDLTSIGLGRLRGQFPGLDGRGVVVGVEDSGVDGSHPALSGRVAMFYNGREKRVTAPTDFDEFHGHGTHVCGTIAGALNGIGVAPKASLAVAGTVLDGEGNFPFDAQLDGMQWFLDIEKNPAVAGRIKVVNNSWKSEGAPDQELFYRALAAWEAAGILPVFSAGNSGHHGPGTITHPHEYPGTFAVGNYGADGKIAESSSEGPALYHDQKLQKPELAAPGENITSAAIGGGYQELSGTSMAAPHVTGVVALLLQVNAVFNPQQIRMLLVEAANVPEGMAQGQWDSRYGFGKLDAYRSVIMAQARAYEFAYGGKIPDATTPPANPGDVFESPAEAMKRRAFWEASLGEVGGALDQYRDTDPTHWLTADGL